jgi:hypothetical protein
MAQTSRNNKSATELRKEVAGSREQLARDLGRVRDELDLPTKIRRSFQRRPATWVVLLIAAGLVTTAVLTRKKKIYVDREKSTRSKGKLLQAGFALGVLRIAANLAKPYIESFVSRRMGRYSDSQRSTKTRF